MTHIISAQRRVLYKTPVRISCSNLNDIENLCQHAQQTVLLPESAKRISSILSKVGSIKSLVSAAGGYDSTLMCKLELEASTGPKSMQIYHTPSLTSFPREIRRAIVPTKPGGKFIYFDFIFPELITALIHARQFGPVGDYQNGTSISYYYTNCFPAGTSSMVIMETLQAFLFGKQATDLAEVLDIPVISASKLLECLNSETDIIEWRTRIIAFARQKRQYVCAAGLDQTKLYLSGEPFKPAEKIVPNKVLEHFAANSFGLWLQDFIQRLREVAGTDVTTLAVLSGVLVEVSPSTKQRVVEFLTKETGPFRTLGFRIGSNFLEAQISNIYIQNNTDEEESRSEDKATN